MMDANITLAAGQGALIINCAPDGSSESKEVVDCSNKLKSCVGSSGTVRITGLLELGSLSSSLYDAVCIVDAVPVTKLDLPTVLRILRPDGVLCMTRVIIQLGPNSKPTPNSITSALTFAGFIKLHAEIGSEYGATETVLSYRVCASKPSYEVGTSLPITLSAKKAAVATAWTLAATDMLDDIDVIDSDTVLDVDDLKKPDPASLRTCGVSDGATKRKACKNCTCGLADELDAENEVSQAPKPSSCGSASISRDHCVQCSDTAGWAAGSASSLYNWREVWCGGGDPVGATCSGSGCVITASANSNISCSNNVQIQPAYWMTQCYLGDAFRCAGCPYRGTPAFKPGDKIQLPVLSMQDDL